MTIVRQTTRGAFGARLGHTFRQVDPPTLTASTSRGRVLGVTEVWHHDVNYGLTQPLQKDDAYLIGLQLLPMTRHELWLDGRPVRVGAFERGTVAFRDLQLNPVAYMEDPFHSLQFYVPRQAVIETADELGQRGVSGLQYGPGEYIPDSTLHHLGECLLPSIRGQRPPNQMFVDQLLFAACVHIVSAYGGTTARQSPSSGAMAPWRQRRAMELMRAHLATGIGLAKVSDACDLSTSAFIRQFKRSTGCSPHQWLMRRRVDRAMELLRDRSLSLSEIALTCGFSDQSHFTRVFKATVGINPGAWRENR